MPQTFTPNKQLASFEPGVQRRLFGVDIPVDQLLQFQNEELDRQKQTLKSAQENFDNITAIKDDLTGFDLQNKQQLDEWNGLRKKYGLDTESLNTDPEWYKNKANVVAMKGKMESLYKDSKFVEILNQQKLYEDARNHIQELRGTNPQLAAIAMADLNDGYINLDTETARKQRLDGFVGARRFSKEAYQNHDVEKVISDIIDTLPEGMSFSQVGIPGQGGYFAIVTKEGVALSPDQSAKFLDERIRTARNADKSIDNSFRAYIAANNLNVDGEGSFDADSDKWMALLKNRVLGTKVKQKAAIKQTPIPNPVGGGRTGGASTKLTDSDKKLRDAIAFAKNRVETAGYSFESVNDPAFNQLFRNAAKIEVVGGELQFLDKDGGLIQALPLSTGGGVTAPVVNPNLSASELEGLNSQGFQEEVFNGRRVIKVPGNSTQNVDKLNNALGTSNGDVDDFSSKKGMRFEDGELIIDLGPASIDPNSIRKNSDTDPNAGLN